jgi:hypothetical protein
MPINLLDRARIKPCSDRSIIRRTTQMSKMANFKMPKSVLYWFPLKALVERHSKQCVTFLIRNLIKFLFFSHTITVQIWGREQKLVSWCLKMLIFVYFWFTFHIEVHFSNWLMPRRRLHQIKSTYCIRDQLLLFLLKLWQFT